MAFDLQEARDGLRSVDRHDADAVAELLDPVAVEAAAGSPDAVDLLVTAVDALHLARPAIRRILVDDSDVDDVAQDVLIAVAESIGRYRGESRFTTWLYQIARFKAIGHLRRARPDSVSPIDPGDLGDAGPIPSLSGPGDAARISSIIATRASIAEILDTLPDLYRAAVVLRDVDGLPYDVLAERLDLNINTAKTRVSRGRALVAAQLVR